MISFEIDISENLKTLVPDIKKVIETNYLNIQNTLNSEIVPDVANFMREYIQTHKTRENGSGYFLEENITYKIASVPGITHGATWAGIGYIPLMDKNVPYWYIINYGGVHPAAGKMVPGFFGSGNKPNPALRGSRVGKERFNYTPNAVTDIGPWMMIPQSPILPMNYIEESVSYAQQRMTDLLLSIANNTYWEK